MNVDNDEDGSELDDEEHYIAGLASDGVPASCAHRLATARASPRQPTRRNEVRFPLGDRRGERLRACKSIFDDVDRTPDPDTCQLEPSQLALDAFMSASGSATHLRGVGSLSVTTRTNARVYDLDNGSETALEFFDPATTRREPYVLVGSRVAARNQCHWHKLATVRLQAATKGTFMILTVSVTIGEALYHTVFYDEEHITLDTAIVDTRAKIAGRWRYPTARESEQRRNQLAKSLPAETTQAVRSNAEINAGVAVQRPSRFKDMDTAEAQARSSSSMTAGEKRVPLGRPHTELLVSDHGPVPLTRRHTHHGMRFTYAMLASAPVDTEVSMSTAADSRDVDGIPEGPALVEFVAVRHSSAESHQTWTRSLGIKPVELRGIKRANYADFEALLRSRIAKNVFTAFFIMQLSDREAAAYSGAIFVHVPQGAWCMAYRYASSLRPPTPSAVSLLS